MKNEIWTVGAIIKWTEQYFLSKGVDSPRLDAEVLLSHVLHKERIYLYVHFDEPLQPEELSVFKAMIKKRAARVPVAYIIGYKEFMGLSFSVSPAVLIPRPDTEILVETVIERLRGRGSVDFADIGTGSGAIALSVLKHLPQSSGWAVDISREALAVAAQNAEAFGVQDRVALLCGDGFAPVQQRRFDAIFSNPPYIPDAAIGALAPEVRAEPRGALAGGADGLDFYRRLIREGAALLKPSGFMAFEVGFDQAERVAAIAAAVPELCEAVILKDYGGNERVILLDKRERG